MTARLLLAALAVAGVALDTASAQTPVPTSYPTVMTVSDTSEVRTRRFGRRARVNGPTTMMVAPAPMMMSAPAVVMPPVGTTAAVTEGVVQTSASEPVAPTAPPMAMPGDPKATPTTAVPVAPPMAVAPAMPMGTPAPVMTSAPMASTDRSTRTRRGLLGRLRR